MEREILFRGKPMFRESNGYVYGYYKQGNIAGVKTDFILPLPKYKNEINEVAVCPLTVEQYTGLIDRNGVRIFEGDILKVERTAVVKYKETKAAFFVETFDGEEEYLGEALCEEDEAEVIGNVHDNPELLKGEENA